MRYLQPDPPSWAEMAVTPPPERIPSAEDFYLRTPLYEFYKINAGNRDEIQQIQYYEGTLDAYCVGCGQVSIFQREPFLNEAAVRFSLARTS